MAMKIFLCVSGPSSPAAQMFEKKISSSVPSGQLQVFRNIDDLAWMLRRPWSRCDVAILIADTRQSLERYLNLKPCLQDIKILLVLPDREPATALTGHKLYPRFFTYIDGNPKELVAVLKNMMHQLQSQNPNRYKEVLDDRCHQDHGSGC